MIFSKRFLNSSLLAAFFSIVKRILAKSEKKIALLSIDYKYEYIDLSKSNIQYFIDTFNKCENLKEIKYPETAEYK